MVIWLLVIGYWEGIFCAGNVFGNCRLNKANVTMENAIVTPGKANVTEKNAIVTLKIANVTEGNAIVTLDTANVTGEMQL